MLHQIKLPHCWLHLNWIVALQHRLLQHLCDLDTLPDDVTLEWVQSLLPKLERRWLNSFCSRNYEDANLLSRMKIIAGFDDRQKGLILSDFRHDIRIRDAYTGNPLPPFKLKSLNSIVDPAIRKEVIRFFESFYSDRFYFNEKNNLSGYYIPRLNNPTERFHHRYFVQGFDGKNINLRVCSFCDGALSGVQVDHFFSKKIHPFLSCHPLNLVPICGECNKVKDERQPIDDVDDGENAMKNWPHPYLRSLDGDFKIGFVRDDKPLHPELLGNDQQTSTRLRNLDMLVDLKSRWLRAYKDRVDNTKERIDGYRRYLQRRGQDGNITRDILLEKLDLWAYELPVGKEAFGLIGKAYLEQAAKEDPDIFGELLDNSMQPLDIY